MWVKSAPNEHEKMLFARAQKYIDKLTWIPWLRMVAVVNSLSMYATHRDSDIDLFIVTSRGTLWWVRVMVTLTFSLHGVWRHGEDIADHFCLSFFVTEDALDMKEIALEDDIYLYFWMYYMRPILVVGDTWERFQKVNGILDSRLQIIDNRLQIIDYRLQITDSRGQIIDFRGQRAEDRGVEHEKSQIWTFIAKICNILIKPIWEWRSRRTWRAKWKPEGVIITSDILKFHDKDRRREIRDHLRQIEIETSRE